MLSGFWYSLKKGAVQMFRNKGMSLASLFSITAMLLILALFFFITVNVNFLSDQLADEFNTIEIFLLDETGVTEARSIADSIAEMDAVSSVKYIPREQAMEEFKERFGDSAYLLDSLADNPLPNALRVELSDLSGGSLVSQVAYGFTGVEDVRFYQEEVDKIQKITKVVQEGALIVIVFLVVVSVLVVSNTIKITVLARQEEIEIMKYIGATNWFVRGPMFLEGMMIGLISSLIALGLSALMYIKLAAGLETDMLQLFNTYLVDPAFVIRNLAWIFVALGVSIGACGSIISMRRFLKV